MTAVEPPRTGPREVTNYGARRAAAGGGAHLAGAQGLRSRTPPALQVLDAILTAGKSSRLYDSLVYDKQIAAQVFSSADLRAAARHVLRRRDRRAGPHARRGRGRRCGRRSRRLRDAPVSAAELDIAKTQLLTQEIRQRETIDGRANELAAAQVIEGSADARQHRHRRAGHGHRRRRAAGGAEIPARRPAGGDPLPARERQSRRARRPKPPPRRADGLAALHRTGRRAAPAAQRQAPPPIGAQPPAVLPTPAERTLPNGLRVIVAHSDDLPLVAASLTFEVRRRVRSAAPGRRRQPHRLAGHRGHRDALGPRHRPPVRGAGRRPRRPPRAGSPRRSASR